MQLNYEEEEKGGGLNLGGDSDEDSDDSRVADVIKNKQIEYEPRSHRLDTASKNKSAIVAMSGMNNPEDEDGNFSDDESMPK